MVKICLITSYTSNYAKIGELCAATMKIYVARHRLEIKIIKDLAFVDRPPAWHRVKFIEEVFNKGFEFVLWLDADAVFMRFNQDIRELIEDNKHLYIVSHHIPEEGNQQRHVPNTGVMLVRNCEWSKKLLKDVWNCTQYINHPWWENAAVIKLFGYHSLLSEGDDSPDQTLLNHVKFLDLSWNALPDICTTLDPIIHHYAGTPWQHRLDGMTKDSLRACLRAAEEALLDRATLVKRVEELERQVHSLQQHRAIILGHKLHRLRKWLRRE